MLKTTISGFAKTFNLGSYNLKQNEGYSFSLLKTEVLAGITVAIALVPEAVAFAFVAGVPPLFGLYAAFIVGLITAVFGGRPGMISGATGALAVVMISLVEDYGVEYLFATVVLMGLLQLFAGIFKMGKFIRIVPQPVMLGFVNGLAIVIGLAQVRQFQTMDSMGELYWMTGDMMAFSILLVGVTMIIIWGTPQITKIIPGPLTAIIAVTVFVLYFDIGVPLVGDLASISGGLPEFHIPIIPIEFDTLLIIGPYALILAMIGLIESLLTLNLVGEITGKKGGASQECIAQGAANTVTGFFGGMGGCAMIGQSMINVKSGGRTRLSAIIGALSLLFFILYGSAMIELIPIAALVGVMFMVVIGTFAWNSIRLLTKVPKSDALVIILVTVVTVAEDLAVAVVVGVIVSALVFAWNSASRIHAVGRDSRTEKGAKVYDIDGPLFFGSVESFLDLFNPNNDPKTVILDFTNSKVVDQSALKAIEDVAARYEQSGRKVKLRHLSKDCHHLLTRTGQLMIDSDDDPEYALAVDYGVRVGILGK